jgi:PAS domain S-box-containing protein
LEEESAQGGLSLCKVLPLDGILLKFQLPDLNGLEFLTALKQLSYPCPPVVIVTDCPSAAIAVKAIKSGAEDYLIEGQTTPDELRLAVRSAIENAQLRRELQNSEARFCTSVENMLDCFGIYSSIRDESGQIVDFCVEYVNAAACENNGMSKEDAIGKRLCELLPAQRESGLFAEFCQVVETGQPLLKESFIYTDVYGEQCPIRILDIRATKWNDGFVASWRDVTERKQVEAELCQNQARLQRIIETSPIGIGFAKSTGEVLAMNNALLSMLGYSREEFCAFGLNWKAISPPEFADLERQAMERLQHSESVETVERYVIRKDGSYLPILIGATGLPGETDEHVAFIVDLTERQQVEAALAEQEQRYRYIFEAVGVAIIEEDFSEVKAALEQLKAQGIEDFSTFFAEHPEFVQQAIGSVRILDVNQATLQLLGARNKAEILTSLHQIFVPETLEVFVKELLAIAAGETYFTAETILQTLPKHRINVLFTITFPPPTASFKRVLVTLSDITEQKRLEQERAALLSREQAVREAAEIANRTKDEFLAVVSHELRSPLNSILGWARLLRTRNLDAATTARALETIERSALSQSQLIEDLLDVSRMTHGNLRLELAPVNLVETMEAAIDAIRPAADAQNISLEFCLVAEVQKRAGGAEEAEKEKPIQNPKSLHPTTLLVLGDRNRLQQIVGNLLANAIKFTPSGGRVEIRLAAVIGSGNEQPPTTNYQLPITSYAQIQVIDTGKGISPSFLPHVFERFERADRTTSSKDGLGLGLAIVRHLVQLHSGTIVAESPGVGQGATFTVKIPLLETRDKRQEARANAEDLLAPSLQGLRILAVDDEADTREFLNFALQEYGAVVKIAASAKEALEILNQFQLDVLISDVGMPETDGYTLLRRLRSQEAEQGKRQIPAIALTAFARQIDRSQAFSAGFGCHLTKPVKPADLVAAIASLLQEQQVEELDD